MSTGVIVIDAIDGHPIMVASLPLAQQTYSDPTNSPDPDKEFAFFRAEKNYELKRGTIEEMLEAAHDYCRMNIPISISPARYWDEEQKSVCVDGTFRITATVYHPEFRLADKCA